uniref:Uncharacterized protein n=1 Tax=Arundo donax TaxID=35708 RepID=A0A0A8YFI3_ARUDO
MFCMVDLSYFSMIPRLPHLSEFWVNADPLPLGG